MDPNKDRQQVDGVQQRKAVNEFEEKTVQSPEPTPPPLVQEYDARPYTESQRAPEPERKGDQKNPLSDRKRAELVLKGENPKNEVPADPVEELRRVRRSQEASAQPEGAPTPAAEEQKQE